MDLVNVGRKRRLSIKELQEKEKKYSLMKGWFYALLRTLLMELSFGMLVRKEYSLMTSSMPMERVTLKLSIEKEKVG